MTHSFPTRRSSDLRLDGPELVLGLVIGEAGGELVIEACGQIDGRALAELTLRCDLDQVLGELLDPLLDAGLALLPDRKSTRLNPVTNAHLVCRLLLGKKKQNNKPK